MADEPFEGWALLELMGHRQRVRHVREVEVAGGKLLRIDIPTDSEDVTEFYGAGAIYALRPVSEEVAREAAKRHSDPRPIRPAGFRELPRYDEDEDDEPWERGE